MFIYRRHKGKGKCRGLSKTGVLIFEGGKWWLISWSHVFDSFTSDLISLKSQVEI